MRVTRHGESWGQCEGVRRDGDGRGGGRGAIGPAGVNWGS